MVLAPAAGQHFHRSVLQKIEALPMLAAAAAAVTLF